MLPKDPLHLLQRDVQLQVADEQCSGCIWIVLWGNVFQIIGELVFLVLSPRRMRTPAVVTTAVIILMMVTSAVSSPTSASAVPSSPAVIIVVTSTASPGGRRAPVVVTGAGRRPPPVPVAAPAPASTVPVRGGTPRPAVVRPAASAAAVSAVARRGHTLGAAFVLLAAGGLVHSLDHGGAVKQDYSALRVQRVTGILK